MLLTRQTIPAVFDATALNLNYTAIENSLADLGPYVVSGLAISAGTGLSVNVASGTANIGGRVTASSFTITGLTDSTTNHLYILNTGLGASNTTGTAPANSAKLGTCVCAAGVVSSVAMGRTSGRQQFIQPQNLVMGGPAAGTTSAGHPDALNLANWNATDIEGKSAFGILPDGAHSANVALLNAANVFTNASGNTFQVTDAGTANEPSVLIVAHRTSGVPGVSFGSAVLLRADNTANALTDQLGINAGWSSATAGAENSLVIFSIRRAGVSTEVLRLTSAGAGRVQLAQDFFHTNASGSWGVFGVGPVTQQATASTTGIAGIRTDTIAHAVADIQTVLTALRAWGVAYGFTANTA